MYERKEERTHLAMSVDLRLRNTVLRRHPKTSSWSSWLRKHAEGSREEVAFGLREEGVVATIERR